MKIETVVDRRIERLYEEYLTLIESLRVKTKDERFELYERMTRILYPHATKTERIISESLRSGSLLSARAVLVMVALVKLALNCIRRRY